jgi:hypothetical protein
MQVVGDEKAVLRLAEIRARRQLEKAPYLLAHMRSLLIPGGGSSDGMPRAPKSDPPLPFRADVIDDCDELVGQIAEWIRYWARQLLEELPYGLDLLWWVDRERDVNGLPANVTPAGAHSILRMLVEWLWVRHSRVIEHPSAGQYFNNVGATVAKYQARYPSAPLPPRKALRRPCPICGRFEVMAKIPQDPRDIEVVCGWCEAFLPWESFSDLIEGWL